LDLSHAESYDKQMHFLIDTNKGSAVPAIPIIMDSSTEEIETKFSQEMAIYRVGTSPCNKILQKN